jgi:Na+:H+ antiporter, NhaA family
MSAPVHDNHAPEAPPEAWPRAKKAIDRVIRPIEHFLDVEASSGLVLLVAAAVALVWANSPWSSAYEHLWHTTIGFHVGATDFSASLHFLINDGLMVVFFFVVGLEIRREMHGGELSEMRRAILPFAAAAGGMIAPAVIYLCVNHDPPTRTGWGVPMATDIAFAVGVLALLGKRIPSGLRVLLLALAIIDDIGAILVIAVFYSSGIEWTWLPLALAGLLLILIMQRVGVRKPALYVPAGFVVWVGFLESGIHPTIAGVAIGLLTPARAWLGGEGFVSRAETAVQRVRSEVAKGHEERELLEPLREIGDAKREAIAPVVRLEAALHPWVAFGIMPLFALANAGVPLGKLSDGIGVSLGVLLGLVLGKPAGVLLGTFVVTRLRLTSLPRRVTWPGILVVGLVAGIGFTMAIFIAGLAFTRTEHLNAAKTAVLAASVLAATAGLVVGRLALAPGETPDVTPTEAECSTAD